MHARVMIEKAWLELVARKKTGANCIMNITYRSRLGIDSYMYIVHLLLICKARKLNQNMRFIPRCALKFMPAVEYVSGRSEPQSISLEKGCQ